MFICSYCGKEFKDNGNRLKHEKHYCLVNPASAALQPKIPCKFCGKLCTASGLTNHEIHCKKNPDRVVHKGVISSWNRGLTKETNETIRRCAKEISDRIKAGETVGSAGKRGAENPSTRAEVRARISESMLGNHNNDPNKTGRGKKGYYKGFFCASTYELAFVIYCLDHKIDIKRYKGWYTYTYKGKTRRYYPDFIIDNCIYEIKGYCSEEVELKTLSVTDKEIKVLYREDMKEIFDYILKTYNKKVDVNIHELYE